MNLLNKIQQSIYELENLNSKKENIKITTSFITKRLFEEVIRDHLHYGVIEQKIHDIPISGDIKLLGVDISFNHYSNDIVIYDETRACIDERFKIIIVPSAIQLNYETVKI